MLQEQPKEKEAPQVLGSLPWQAQVRLREGHGGGASAAGTATAAPKNSGDPPVSPSHPKTGPAARWDLLVVQAAAAAGGVAVLGEGVGELLVQRVAQRAGDALPGQDQDDDDGVLAMVAGPVPHQAQQLLLLVVSPDHLENGGAKSDHSKPLPGWGRAQKWVLAAFHSSPWGSGGAELGGLPWLHPSPWALGRWGGRRARRRGCRRGRAARHAPRLGSPGEFPRPWTLLSLPPCQPRMEHPPLATAARDLLVPTQGGDGQQRGGLRGGTSAGARALTHLAMGQPRELFPSFPV